MVQAIDAAVPAAERAQTAAARMWTRQAATASLALALGLLPFEERLPQLSAGSLTITTVELAWAAALVAFVIMLLNERRWPRLPWLIAAGIGIMLLAGSASALLADGHNGEAFTFVGRSAAGWLLFVAVADVATDRRAALLFATVIVAGGVVSAALGLIVLAQPPSFAESLGVREFVAAGARRLVGSFDYPNTAAMYFEVGTLLAFGLVASFHRLLSRIALVLGGALLIASMILTLSRGASLGIAVGLTMVAVLAVLARRRRIALGALALMATIGIATVGVQAALTPLERLFSDAQRGLFEAKFDAPNTAEINAGQLTSDVTVSNTGTVTWNSDGSNRFMLGYHWLHPDTGQLLGDGTERGAIGLVAPGQMTTVHMRISAPDAARGYLIAWDIVQPGNIWFSQHGVPLATTRIVSTDVLGSTAPDASHGGDVVLFPDAPIAPSREELWGAAATMIGQHPALGVGPGTFRLRYGPYLGLVNWDDRVHANNMYLEIASTTGLIGLAAFLIVVCGSVLPLLARLARARSAPPSAWLFAASIAAAAVAFLGHGALDYFLGFNPTGGLFWATLGLAVAATSATWLDAGSDSIRASQAHG